ncbi:hypothetical protein CRENPOLYSF1_540007 [Crenothrix polyspora]|uniref:Uncharacterized protein n=1 Tax=Crenothrix polyspora TaxID=360316 RepID=A0A1R4HDV7_9GAMM|nr:hypothetical protein CRENPOLYSF1_540007 [Crenothrix polyspora]
MLQSFDVIFRKPKAPINSTEAFCRSKIPNPLEVFINYFHKSGQADIEQAKVNTVDYAPPEHNRLIH